MTTEPQLPYITAAQRRHMKDDLIRREHAARNRAQLAAVAVDQARDLGGDAYEDAMASYHRAAAALEELMHETGEFD